MKILLWFLAGGLCSSFSIASQWWFIRHLNPQDKRFTQWALPGGILLRFTLTGGLFYLALLQGISTSIFFIVGLLAFRWIILVWINSNNTLVEMGKLL